MWGAFGCPRDVGPWVQPVGPRPLATWVSLEYGLLVLRQVLYEFVEDPYGRLPVGQFLAEAAHGVGKRRELFVAFPSVQQVVHLCAFFRFLLDVEPYDLVVGLKLPLRSHGGRVAQCVREPLEDGVDVQPVARLSEVLFRGGLFRSGGALVGEPSAVQRCRCAVSAFGGRRCPRFVSVPGGHAWRSRGLFP